MNGTIMPLAKAALPITDIAIQRGYAVFDSMVASNDTILDLDHHIARFVNSAKIARIPLKYSKTELREALQKVLRKNKLPFSKVRIFVTPGQSPDSLTFVPSTGSLFIIVEPYNHPASEIYDKGVTLMTAEYQRPIAQAKSTNYMLAVNLQEERRKRKAFEILYTFQGTVYECSTSNFFLVKGKQLLTSNQGVLSGITRKFVLAAAKKAGLVPVERVITMKDLRNADEAFISGTYKGIVPVIKVDDIIIGNGKVGHAAQSFQNLYVEFGV